MRNISPPAPLNHEIRFASCKQVAVATSFDKLICNVSRAEQNAFASATNLGRSKSM